MGQAAVKTRMLNFRTTEKDFQTVRDFARFQGKSVSAFIMEAVWDKIEEWEDVQAIKEFERRNDAGEEITFFSHEEMIERLGVGDGV